MHCRWSCIARVKGVPGERIAALAGDLADAEAMVALKDLMAGFQSPNLDCRQDGGRYDVSERAGYLFNTTIVGIEQADAILLVGTNPRWEAPLINARIRKRFLMGGLKVGAIGPRVDLTYPVAYLGAGGQTLADLAAGKGEFVEVLRAAQKPMVVVGMGGLSRRDGAAIQATVRALAETYGMVRDGWNGFNVLHTAAARVGGLDLGFLPAKDGRDTLGILEGAASGAIEVLFLLGADEIDPAKLGCAFVVYQGHHGDRAAARADVILPGAAYTEKNATYVNTEGRVQQTRLAVFPPGEAREDWKIIRALSAELGRVLPYDNLAQVRQRLVQVNPLFAKLGAVVSAPWRTFGTDGAIDQVPFTSSVDNFYMTDPISRVSATMAECTETFLRPAEGKTGTHG
ncbi:hypothetical protein WCLP8_3430002 [uncultured Gammaproteobacteria bacterium]